jgi:hypothetical protein
VKLEPVVRCSIIDDCPFMVNRKMSVPWLSGCLSWMVVLQVTQADFKKAKEKVMYKKKEGVPEGLYM